MLKRQRDPKNIKVKRRKIVQSLQPQLTPDQHVMQDHSVQLTTGQPVCVQLTADREEPVHHPWPNPDSPLQARRVGSRPIVNDELELGNWAENVSILAVTPDRVRNDQINESAHESEDLIDQDKCSALTGVKVMSYHYLEHKKLRF